MPSLVVIGPQLKEKQREAYCALPPPPTASIVPKDPSVNPKLTFFTLNYDIHGNIYHCECPGSNSLLRI